MTTEERLDALEKANAELHRTITDKDREIKALKRLLSDSYDWSQEVAG